MSSEIFCQPNSNKLKRPLGSWKKTKFKQTIWEHFYDSTTCRLYKKHNRTINPWTFHRPTTHNKFLFNASPGMPQDPPPFLSRITMDSESPNTWSYTHPFSEKVPIITLQRESSSNTSSPSTPGVTTHTTQGPYIEVPPSLTHIICQTKKLDTATDGSVLQGIMTASWAIKLETYILKTGGKIQKEPALLLLHEQREEHTYIY